MTGDASRASDASHERTSVDAMTEVYENAVAGLVRLILELTSTNEALDYENGARIRVELEAALQEAQHTFEAMPDGPARVSALRRLDGLRTMAERQLRMAPPGEPSASPREVDEWKARRRGHGSGRARPLRRPHTDTRPGSPGAMPAATDTDREMSQAAPVPLLRADSGPEKDRR